MFTSREANVFILYANSSIIGQMQSKLQDKPWWSYLTENQRDLLEESRILLEREESGMETTPLGGFHDYGFVVFPSAKAYEGFLKKLFFDLGLIREGQYFGNHFRIGKALNPGLEERWRDEGWVWRDLEKRYGRELPQFLWETWINCRNLVFHWFPRHKNFINLKQAREKHEMIVKAIGWAFEECGVQ